MSKIKFMRITSPANPRVKRIVKLKDRQNRKPEGLAIVDGVHEILQAVRAGVPLEEIYFCQQQLAGKLSAVEQQKLIEMASEVFEVSPVAFEKIAFGNRREGALGVFRPEIKSLSTISLAEKPLIVIADHIEKPGNLGAILRSCDGAGVDLLCVCDGQLAIFNPHIIRASMGAVFTVPVVPVTREQVREYLLKRKIKIYAASPQAKNIYTAVDYREGIALVVGSEHQGLDAFWLKECAAGIFIPMRGEGDSLNVSVSTAVILYEALRQRRAFAPKRGGR